MAVVPNLWDSLYMIKYMMNAIIFIIDLFRGTVEKFLRFVIQKATKANG